MLSSNSGPSYEDETTWRSRGRLPHLERQDAIYFITFRLAGSLPKHVLLDIKAAKRNEDAIDEFLDSGHGECWLKDERIAALTVNTIKHWSGSRYLLHAWCVMPNHVHVVLGPKRSLAEVLHSWKSYIAHEANRMLSRTGDFWQREYYDHIVRNDEELHRDIEYTINNPVKAGLCENSDEWEWSGVGDMYAGETPALR